MRTVEQVTNDFKKAQDAEAAAHQVTEKYRAELQSIYHEAKNALGIKDFLPR